MISLILIVLGLTGFVISLFDKNNTWDKIAKRGARSNFRLFYELTQCQFCLIFWIGFFITGVIIVFWPFNWLNLAVPFIVRGIIYLIGR